MIESSTESPPLDRVRERTGGRSARIRADVLAAVREELLADGYGRLAYRAVAQRAGVDPATVYRRWPSRPQLVVDALRELVERPQPSPPDTGSVADDLGAFLDGVLAELTDPTWLALFRAYALAGAEDGSLGSPWTVWEDRLGAAQVMVTRAIERGELPVHCDPQAVIEHLVAPGYFRALVSSQPIEPGFATRCVRYALAAARC
jgi:AcrR family transcriptional regulator